MRLAKRVRRAGEPSGVVGEGADALGDDVEFGLADGSAVEADEGAESVGVPAAFEEGAAGVVVAAALPAVGVDGVEAEAAEHPHVVVAGDLIDAEGEEGLAVEGVASVFVDGDGVGGLGRVEEPGGLGGGVSGLVGGGEGEGMEAGLPAVGGPDGEDGGEVSRLWLVAEEPRGADGDRGSVVVDGELEGAVAGVGDGDVEGLLSVEDAVRLEENGGGEAVAVDGGLLGEGPGAGVVGALGEELPVPAARPERGG